VGEVTMSSTKKLLIAFDPKRPNATSSDFLIPIMNKDTWVLSGLVSNRTYGFGMVVFTGRNIAEDDLLARLIDNKTPIDNETFTLAYLSSYIEQIRSFTVGNIVSIVPTSDSSDRITLKLIAKSPNSFKATNDF